MLSVEELSIPFLTDPKIMEKNAAINTDNIVSNAREGFLCRFNQANFIMENYQLSRLIFCREKKLSLKGVS